MSVLRSVEISFFFFLFNPFFSLLLGGLSSSFFFFLLPLLFFLLDFFLFCFFLVWFSFYFSFGCCCFVSRKEVGGVFKQPLWSCVLYIYLFLNLLFDVFVRVTFTFFPLFFSPNFLPTYLGNPSSSSHFIFLSLSLSLLFNFFHFFGGFHTPFFTLARSPPLQLGQCLRKRVSPLFLLSPLIYFLEELPKSTTTLNTHCSLKH